MWYKNGELINYNIPIFWWKGVSNVRCCLLMDSDQRKEANPFYLCHPRLLVSMKWQLSSMSSSSDSSSSLEGTYWKSEEGDTGWNEVKRKAIGWAVMMLCGKRVSCRSVAVCYSSRCDCQCTISAASCPLVIEYFSEMKGFRLRVFSILPIIRFLS